MCSVSDGLHHGLKLDRSRQKAFFFHYHTVFGCWPVRILASVRTHYFLGCQPPEIAIEEGEGDDGFARHKERAGGQWGMQLPSLVLAQEEE